MDVERFIGYIALCWLVGSVLLMARSIRRGCDLAETLAQRDPATYEALGRPRPGYFDSQRRRRFARFVGQREFESLADAALSFRFEAYRKHEARLIPAILASGAAVAVLGLVVRHAV
jgi:hypothetical protein